MSKAVVAMCDGAMPVSGACFELRGAPGGSLQSVALRNSMGRHAGRNTPTLWPSCFSAARRRGTRGPTCSHSDDSTLRGGLEGELSRTRNRLATIEADFDYIQRAHSKADQLRATIADSFIFERADDIGPIGANAGGVVT